MNVANAEREFDLVLLGATGFTGRLVAEHLISRHGTDGALRWALVGRSLDKLTQLRESLGEPAAGLSLLVVDSHDRSALDALAARANTVCTTVGPYAVHGSDLIAACVAAGTDYCDLCGEVPWMRRMLDAHAEGARSSGARIVHCCGFDSIPSDMGVAFLQQQAMERLGRPLPHVRMGVAAMRGSMSGGTVASMLDVIQEIRRSRETARILRNPYSLCPPEARDGLRQPSTRGPRYDAGLGAWCAPFIMAQVNTRIVHRSHALLGRPWGESFTYDEAMLTGRGFKGRRRAIALSLGIGGFAVAASLAPTRALMKRAFLPAPGEGPSAEQRASGFFKLIFDGRDESGEHLRVQVTGDADPGYGSTSKMLGEAAFTLATQLSRHALPGGFWTPGTALGERLLAQLIAHAGLRFELI